MICLMNDRDKEHRSKLLQLTSQKGKVVVLVPYDIADVSKQCKVGSGLLA